MNGRCNYNAYHLHHLAVAYLFFHPTHLWVCFFWSRSCTAWSTPPMQRSSKSSTCSRHWQEEFFLTPTLSAWVGAWGRRVSKAGPEDHLRVPERLPGEHKLEFAGVVPPHTQLSGRLSCDPRFFTAAFTVGAQQRNSATNQNHITVSHDKILSACTLSAKQKHVRKSRVPSNSFPVTPRSGDEEALQGWKNKRLGAKRLLRQLVI